MTGPAGNSELCFPSTSMFPSASPRISGKQNSLFPLGPVIKRLIDHFTVVGLVTWPLNGSEAGGDLVLIQTSLLLLCKSSCSYAN